MSNVLITNKLDGERCITQNGGDNDWNTWDGYKFLACDRNNKNQQLSFNDQGGHFQIQTNGAEMFITRQNLDCCTAAPFDIRHSFAGDSNNNRDGKSDQFIIQGVGKNHGKSGLDAVKNGPFIFGSNYYQSYKVDFEGDTLRNFDSNANKESQKWIQYDLYKKCQERGIPFDSCIASDLDNCNYQINKDNYSVCPKEYCQNPGNVNKTECVNWCNQNPGACDDAMIKYCKANPKDTDRCGCINTEKYEKLREKLAAQGTTLIPSCHIKECVNANAYKPQTLKDQRCPDQQICLQGIDLQALGTSQTELKDVNFECNISSEKTETVKNTTKNKKLEKEDDEEEEEDDEDNGATRISTRDLYIIGAIAIGFFILILFFLLLKI